MRILPFIALNITSLIATTGLASDVEYKLDENTFAHHKASISIRPAAFKIADRTWAAPGVEQAPKDLLPPVNFDFAAAPRVHIETSHWLENEVWPRSREVFTAPSKREAYEAWAESGYVF